MRIGCVINHDWVKVMINEIDQCGYEVRCSKCGNRRGISLGTHISTEYDLSVNVKPFVMLVCFIKSAAVLFLISFALSINLFTISKVSILLLASLTFIFYQIYVLIEGDYK